MTTHTENDLAPFKYKLTVSGSTLSIEYETPMASVSLSAGDTVEDSFKAVVDGGISGPLEVRVYDAPNPAGPDDKAVVSDDSPGDWARNEDDGYSYKDFAIPASHTEDDLTFTLSISTESLDPIPVSQTQIIVTKRKVPIAEA